MASTDVATSNQDLQIGRPHDLGQCDAPTADRTNSRNGHLARSGTPVPDHGVVIPSSAKGPASPTGCWRGAGVLTRAAGPHGGSQLQQPDGEVGMDNHTKSLGITFETSGCVCA